MSLHKMRRCSDTNTSSVHYLNMEQLTKALASLLDLYDANRDSDSMYENEAEFRSFYVLLHLGSHSQPTVDLYFIVVVNSFFSILNCSLMLGNIWYVKCSYLWSTGRITFIVVSSCTCSNNQVQGNVFRQENIAVFSILISCSTRFFEVFCFIKVNLFRRIFFFGLALKHQSKIQWSLRVSVNWNITSFVKQIFPNWKL